MFVIIHLGHNTFGFHFTSDPDPILRVTLGIKILLKLDMLYCNSSVCCLPHSLQVVMAVNFRNGEWGFWSNHLEFGNPWPSTWCSCSQPLPIFRSQSLATSTHSCQSPFSLHCTLSQRSCKERRKQLAEAGGFHWVCCITMRMLRACTANENWSVVCRCIWNLFWVVYQEMKHKCKVIQRVQECSKHPGRSVMQH